MTGPGPTRRPAVAVLLRRMSAALRAATSVHINGTIRHGAKTLGVDLGLTRSGELSGQVSENRTVITVLATRGHSYVKLTAAFLRLAHLPAIACSQFCGRYLELPAAQSRELLTGLSLASMTQALTSTPASQVKLLGTVTVAGQLAWLLQDGHRNSIYVAARGKPYALREVAAPPSTNGATLTQWNAVRIPGPPPPSQIVHPRQLMA
jgi:hypothetical protein